MKSKLLVLLFFILIVPSAFAIGDIAVGPLYGYGMPVGNEWAKPGPMYGVQARVSLIPLVAFGGFYNARNYGDITLTYFEGEPFEWSEDIDGGDVKSFGLNAYFGKMTGMGVNYFLIGGIGSHKWTRDYKEEEDSKFAYALGLGFELVLPKNIGIEARGMFEAASTGNKSTWKSVIAYGGLNYHFELGIK